MPQTTAEAQARKVDALYRAHLLRAASDNRGKAPGVDADTARVLFAAARAQEIRAELTDNDAAARVAVLIHRAR